MSIPEQQKNLQSWAEKRDSILQETAQVQSEYEKYSKLLVQAGQDLDAIHQQIAEARGRIDEMSALEDRMRGSLSSDILKLENRKTELEIDIDVKRKERDNAINSKISLMADIDKIIELYDKVFVRMGVTRETIGEMAKISETNLSDVKVFVAEVKKVCDEVIEKANKNVKQTNIVLEKLPKYIFEMQKPIPVRRIPVDEQKPVEVKNKK